MNVPASGLMVLAGLATMLVAGCNSYVIVQSNVFYNEDGDKLTVEYGRSEREHVNTFVAPTNGLEMEFKSKLLVKARFDNHVGDRLVITHRGSVTNRIELAGESFKAWQCMNFQRSGTMYKTDNDEWMLLANGFTCFVYLKDDDTGKYRTVYRGLLCETPDSDYRPSDKWRSLKKNAEGNWK